MNYPIQLRFKKLTLTNEMRVIDADQNIVGYVYQKLLKLKEEIIIYSDQTKSKVNYRIRADKVIDWSPTYTLYDDQDVALASTKRHGAKSILNATYDVFLKDKQIGTLREQNPWVKLADTLFSMIPIVGIFTGYLINPKYDFKDDKGNILATLVKKPAFLEGFYEIIPGEITKLPEKSQQELSLIIMMIATMERIRG